MVNPAFQPYSESPLAHFDLAKHARAVSADDKLWANEVPDLGYAIVRGDSNEAGFVEAIQQVTGLALPTQAHQFSQSAEGIMLWNSPDEWLLISPRPCLQPWLSALEQAFQGLFAHTIDSSGGLTQVYLGGPEHLTLLRHLSHYDFASLTPGKVVSTVLGKAGIQVYRVNHEGVFVIFRRSFADYVWRMLRRAGQPYGFFVGEM